MRFELLVGNAGWIHVRAELGAAFLRFKRNESGRLTLRELYFPDEGSGVSSSAVQRLPLSQIEAMANDPVIAGWIDRQAGFPGPDLGTAAAYFARTYGADPSTPIPTEVVPWLLENRTWADDMLCSQIEWSRTSREDFPEDFDPRTVFPRPRVPVITGVPVEIPDGVPDLALAVPNGRRFDDSFYESVAQIYSKLAPTTRAPAPLIAEANRVPVSTVHGWIKEARKRGKLGPAARGKAG